MKSHHLRRSAFNLTLIGFICATLSSDAFASPTGEFMAAGMDDFLTNLNACDGAVLCQAFAVLTLLKVPFLLFMAMSIGVYINRCMDEYEFLGRLFCRVGIATAAALITRLVILPNLRVTVPFDLALMYMPFLLLHRSIQASPINWTVDPKDRKRRNIWIASFASKKEACISLGAAFLGVALVIASSVFTTY